MRRDYYAVLGITATAAPREVRQAYRRLARQYSPDVNFWDERARTLFEEIAEAYRVLSDPAARDMYDRYGAAAGALGAGRRGDDVHVVIDLTFAEAVRGARRTLAIARFSACARCASRGRDAAGAPCATCAGRGVTRSTDALAVDVPPGADTGVQFRVAGEGSAGPFGGPRGDLIVSTRVAEHPFFTRRGDGVHCDVPVSVWEALRGARINVPTPQGDATIVIPPGTADGTVIRLRGQGLPSLARDGIGDLNVTVRLVMPQGLDARTDERVRELERLAPVDARAGIERFDGGAA